MSKLKVSYVEAWDEDDGSISGEAVVTIGMFEVARLPIQYAGRDANDNQEAADETAAKWLVRVAARQCVCGSDPA